MSIIEEYNRIKNAKTNLKTGLNAILPSEHQISDDEKLDTYADHLEHIETGSGGGGGENIDINVTINGSSAIMVAELPNVSLSITNSSGVVLDTKNTGSAGGVVIFSVSGNGTYTVTATDSYGTELWTNDIVIDGVGTYNCKTGKSLNDYTWAEINTASVGGYAKYMWSVGDGKTFVSTDSIFNNYEFIIIGFGHDTLASDGVSKAGITFMMKKRYSGTSYNINLKLYLNGSSTYRNVGGYRSSLMRQRSLPQGSEIYSQASGVTADLLASGFRYADGTICPLYSYDESTDTYTEATGETFDTAKVYHIKGYYKTLGTIEETEFVEGKHFIYSTSGYTVPSTWESGTTYYVIYQTLQEDGVFYSALSEIMQYIKPIHKVQSTGNAKTTLCTTEEKVWHLAVEEVFGINRNSVLDSGSAGTSAQAYNAQGEGSIYDYFKNEYQHGKIALGSTWWTRSPNTNHSTNWNSVNTSGNINTNTVHTTTNVRPCFCI